MVGEGRVPPPLSAASALYSALASESGGAQGGDGGAPGEASARAEGVGQLSSLPPPSAAPPPPPPRAASGWRVLSVADTAPAAPPTAPTRPPTAARASALARGGSLFLSNVSLGARGGLELGPPPPRPPKPAPPPFLGIVDAVARAAPSRLRPPASASTYVPVRRRRSRAPELSDEDEPPSVRAPSRPPGRPSAQPVASITRAELDLLLQQPPAAWKAALCMLYDLPNCNSGNLRWVQSKLAAAVSDEDTRALLLEDKEEE